MNRYPMIFVLCLLSSLLHAQIPLPVNFYVVKSTGPIKHEDYYTDGQYNLNISTFFQTSDPKNDDEIKYMLSKGYSLEFNKTKDGIFYGTGFSGGKYKYIVNVNKLCYVLSAKNNNKGFSNYSIWLIDAIRKQLKAKQKIWFAVSSF